MLPFRKLNRDTQPMKSRISRAQLLANRFFYWLYKLRAERSGSQNNFQPEHEITSALTEKSLQLKTKKDWDVPLANSRYILFDTETTGFYPYQGDEIISIAAVVVENGQIREDLIFNELVNPYRGIPPAIQELTGITAEMVSDKRHVCAVLNDFLDFIGDSVLVAHNAEFDLAFINIKLNWYTQTEIYNQVIDTYKLSRALSPEFAAHDLDTLLKNHHVPIHARHTALGDSLMTAEIFLKYLACLREQNILTLKELHYYLHIKNSMDLCN